MKKDILIIAHRGFHNKEKENSLESFEKAVDLGIGMIEFDVRKTMDNVIIVFHDPEIRDKLDKNMNYEEMCKLAGYPVLKYEDALKSLKGKIKLDIELKEEGYEQEFLDMTLKYIKKGDFFVSSFCSRALRKIKEIDKSVKTCLLIDFKIRNFLRLFYNYYPGKLIEYSKADMIAPNMIYVKRKFIEKSLNDKKKIIVWTVDSEKWIKKMLELGADGIITNRPDIALELRKN